VNTVVSESACAVVGECPGVAGRFGAAVIGLTSAVPSRALGGVDPARLRSDDPALLIQNATQWWDTYLMINGQFAPSGELSPSNIQYFGPRSGEMPFILYPNDLLVAPGVLEDCEFTFDGASHLGYGSLGAGIWSYDDAASQWGLLGVVTWGNAAAPLAENRPNTGVSIFTIQHWLEPLLERPSPCSAGGPQASYCQNCTRGKGYWKTHNRYRNNQNQQIPWPMDEDTLLCGQTWLSILQAPAGGNTWISLAQAWICAKLNVANLAPSGPIQSALTNAEALLTGCTISAQDQATALSLATELHDYNQGTSGPGRCDK